MIPLFRYIKDHMALPHMRTFGPVLAALAFSPFWSQSFKTLHGGAHLLLVGIGAILTWSVIKYFWENFIQVRRLQMALRYFPVADVLDSWEGMLSKVPKLLEVGSSDQGLGNLVSYPFVGCDISFEDYQHPNLRPVQSSATDLCFEDDSFDVVVSVDAIEHLSTEEDRCKAIHEMLRVARKAVVVAFPCGAAAVRTDRALLQYHRRRGWPAPFWLNEHLTFGIPTKRFMDRALEGRDLSVIIVPNESPAIHLWLMKKEPNRYWVAAGALAMLLATPLIRLLNRHLLCPEETYRTVYVLLKDDEFKEPLLKSKLLPYKALYKPRVNSGQEFAHGSVKEAVC
jgi:hypothetical protein